MNKKSVSSPKRMWSNADPRVFVVASIAVVALSLMLVFQTYGSECVGPGDEIKSKQEPKSECFHMEEEKRDDGLYHVVSVKETCSIDRFTVIVYLPSGEERIVETIAGPKTAIFAQKDDLWIRVTYVSDDGSVVNQAKKLQ